MTVTEKQELYKIAERYSHHFEKNLTYVPVHVRNSKRYALAIESHSRFEY
jgi:hypothetical protein